MKKRKTSSSNEAIIKVDIVLHPPTDKLGDFKCEKGFSISAKIGTFEFPPIGPEDAQRQDSGYYTLTIEGWNNKVEPFWLSIMPQVKKMLSRVIAFDGWEIHCLFLKSSINIPVQGTYLYEYKEKLVFPISKIMKYQRGIPNTSFLSLTKYNIYDIILSAHLSLSDRYVLYT